MYPEIDSATGIPVGISISQLKNALRQQPVAVLLTEPGYLGTLSDLPLLIEEAHASKVPVVLDAAWGGHFGFHPRLPCHGMQVGADAVITSVHKALPGYSAAALLLARSSLLKVERLQQSFEMTHTTSPSGAALASIDGVRALMQSRGCQLIDQLLKNVALFKERVQSHFSPPIFLNESDFADSRFDPAKLVLRVSQLGACGVELEKDLLQQGISVEMADRDMIVFHATVADSAASFENLADKLIPILKMKQSAPRASAVALTWSISPTQGCSLRDAFFASTEMVAACDAAGCVSADVIAPYPPGVAIVAPGEVLTHQVLAGLREIAAAGVRIAYATDPSLARYRVVSKMSLISQ
jgi:lysine decarboxylase